MQHLAQEARQKLAQRVSAGYAYEAKNRALEVRHIFSEQGRKVTSYSFSACGREAGRFAPPALPALALRLARRMPMIAGRIERMITTAIT